VGERSTAQTASRGVGFTSLLTILFIALKLTGVINWSWFWVLIPVVFSIVLAIAILIFLLVLFIRISARKITGL